MTKKAKILLLKSGTALTVNMQIQNGHAHTCLTLKSG